VNLNELPTRLEDLDDDFLAEQLSDFGLVDIGLECIELQSSLYAFVKAAWHLVEPTQPFVDGWHIRALCTVLQDCYHKRIKRVVINVPPGTMKSLLIEVFFPAWAWAKDAGKRFLTASYGQHLTIRDNLRCRSIIESPWYQERWPVKLVDDQNTKTRYNTTAGGWRIATSVEGVGTGEHPDFINIDDALSAAGAESALERQTVIDWFDRTIATRLGRNPVIIVVAQRLHMGDLCGHLIARGGWTHVRWPMRYERCGCATAPVMNPDEERRCALHKADPAWVIDARDERSTDGELLAPLLFPEEKVRQLELDLGPYGSAGQLQQRPSPEGGGLFKREWFKFADAAPSLSRVVRGWDTAGTEGGGDYTVGAKVSEEFAWHVVDGKRELKSTGRIFVEDVQRDQLGPNGVDLLIKAIAETDGKKVPVREEREGGASGKSQIAARTKLLIGWDYKEVQLGTNKVVRAKAFRSQAEGGNVYLVRASWNEAYLVELCNFPTGTHDDQVDATSCAFNTMLLEPPPRKVKAVWGRQYD
jgi:predicted phage terminase large subunit-like protein